MRKFKNDLFISYPWLRVLSVYYNNVKSDLIFSAISNPLKIWAQKLEIIRQFDVEMDLYISKQMILYFPVLMAVLY